MTNNKPEIQPCGCPIHIDSMDDLCIACQIAWEEWMITTIAPAVKRAMEAAAASQEVF